MNMLKILTAADKLLIALLLVVLVGSFFAVDSLSIVGTTVLVQVSGETIHKANLVETHRISIQGARGKLTLETRDGKVALTQADCPNRICVRSGWRSMAGDVIVCVPNATIVRILTEQRYGINAVTG